MTQPTDPPISTPPGLQTDPQVIGRGTTMQRRPRRRLAAALTRRRRLRVGIVQLVYVVAAVILGLLVPGISVGASVPASRATEMLVAVGAGFVPFIGIVYSMLFLVVQFGSTTYTPRLNLFRDSPIVWHGFSFFTAVIVFAFTAVFEVGTKSETSLLVPIVLGIAVLIAITMMRALQTAAFKSIQLASILEQLNLRGRQIIDGVHPEPLLGSDPGIASNGPRASEAAAASRDLRWSGRAVVLQRVDVRQLLSIAEHNDARIHLSITPGQTVFDGDRIAVVVGGENLSEGDVHDALGVGSERTFDQDPALALRLLADIALRALSPAINDPTTAVQSLDVVADLLRVLIRRDLGEVVLDDAAGTPRVVVRLWTWEDYISVSVDEIIAMETHSAQVQQRLAGLLQGLVTIAPDQHRPAVERRLATMAAREG